MVFNFLFNSRVGSKRETYYSEFPIFQPKTQGQIKENERSAHPKPMAGKAQGQIFMWLHVNSIPLKIKCTDVILTEAESRRWQLARRGRWSCQCFHFA